jgi:cell division protein ZapA
MSREPVRVHIFNQSYTLLSDGDPREVQEIAQQVDELMTSIAGRGNTGDATRVAVLACMHLADKLRAYETQSARITNLLEDTIAGL